MRRCVLVFGFSFARTKPFARGDFTLKSVCSIFSRISRFNFARSLYEATTRAQGRAACAWFEQLVAKLFCHLAQAKSLRERPTEGC